MLALIGFVGMAFLFSHMGYSADSWEFWAGMGLCTLLRLSDAIEERVKS